MTFEDYIRQVTADAVEAIELGGYDYCTDFYKVIDDMWMDDDITGNASGSYTFSSAKAMEYTYDLIWDDRFRDECKSLDIELDEVLSDPETCDVTARCLALSYARNDIESAWQDRCFDLSA